MQVVVAMQQGQRVLSTESSIATASNESDTSLAVATLVIGSCRDCKFACPQQD